MGMEVNKPGAVTPVGGAEGGSQDPESRQDGKEDDIFPHAHPRRDIADAVSALGEEVTPAVQKALDALMAEIGRLQQELESARGRTAHLEEQADAHSVLPILNRRAFVRELGRMLANSGQLGTASSLLCLHVANADGIRAKHGRSALDQGLAHACKVLAGELHMTDVVGCLGGNDLGVVLLVADRDAARAKGADLQRVFKVLPFQWLEEDLFLDVRPGFCLLEPDLDPEAALEAADRDMGESEDGEEGEEGGGEDKGGG